MKPSNETHDEFPLEPVFDAETEDLLRLADARVIDPNGPLTYDQELEVRLIAKIRELKALVAKPPTVESANTADLLRTRILAATLEAKNLGTTMKALRREHLTLAVPPEDAGYFDAVRKWIDGPAGGDMAVILVNEALDRLEGTLDDKVWTREWERINVVAGIFLQRLDRENAAPPPPAKEPTKP